MGPVTFIDSPLLLLMLGAVILLALLIVVWLAWVASRQSREFDLRLTAPLLRFQLRMNEPQALGRDGAAPVQERED